MNEEEIRAKLKEYKFYHIIQLTKDIQTPGEAGYVSGQKVVLRAMRSLEFKNKRVLDIGCRDGLLSFEAEKLGAQEIIGIDNNLSLAAVEFLIPYFNSKVRMHELNINDLTPEHFGVFDVVIFSGVLYHLRYPFWALKRIRDVMPDEGQLILETAVFLDKNKDAMLFCPVDVESPYEGSSPTFFNLKGLNDTLLSLGLIVEKVELLKGWPKKEWLKPNQMLRDFLRPRKIIDRATLLCRKSPKALNVDLDNYWNKTHKTIGWKAAGNKHS